MRRWWLISLVIRRKSLPVWLWDMKSWSNRSKRSKKTKKFKKIKEIPRSQEKIRRSLFVLCWLLCFSSSSSSSLSGSAWFLMNVSHQWRSETGNRWWHHTAALPPLWCHFLFKYSLVPLRISLSLTSWRVETFSKAFLHFLTLNSDVIQSPACPAVIGQFMTGSVLIPEFIILCLKSIYCYLLYL